MGYLDIGNSDAELLIGGSGKGDKGYIVEPTIFLTQRKGVVFGLRRSLVQCLVLGFSRPKKRLSSLRMIRHMAWLVCFLHLTHSPAQPGLTGLPVYPLFTLANSQIIAQIYTANLSRGLRVASALEAGGIGINAPYMPEVQAPFGGMKQSGNGHELGEEGLKAYLEAKTIEIKEVDIRSIFDSLVGGTRCLVVGDCLLTVVFSMSACCKGVPNSTKNDDGVMHVSKGSSGPLSLQTSQDSADPRYRMPIFQKTGHRSSISALSNPAYKY